MDDRLVRNAGKGSAFVIPFAVVLSVVAIFLIWRQRGVMRRRLAARADVNAALRDLLKSYEAALEDFAMRLDSVFPPPPPSTKELDALLSERLEGLNAAHLAAVNRFRRSLGELDRLLFGRLQSLPGRSRGLPPELLTEARKVAVLARASCAQAIDSLGDH
jgi:hypothetical protein